MLGKCPFCNSPDVVVIECEDAAAGCSTFWAQCDSCDARGPTSEYQDGAVIYWNNIAN